MECKRNRVPRPVPNLPNALCRWSKIAAKMPGKTSHELQRRYRLLEVGPRRRYNISGGGAQSTGTAHKASSSQTACNTVHAQDDVKRIHDGASSADACEPHVSTPACDTEHSWTRSAALCLAADSAPAPSSSPSSVTDGGCMHLQAKKQKISASGAVVAKGVAPAAAGAADRRKGVPWTEDEHRLFLLGLAKFGKGNAVEMHGGTPHAEGHVLAQGPQPFV
eukprot:132735-Chlamydomonas_euryale.AAC.9